MSVIHLKTWINAPCETVFDLARSVEAHQESAKETNEHAIGGVTHGLLEKGDEVTWEAQHLGIRQRLTVRITEFERPGYFQDIMLRGAFRSMKHDHWFEAQGTQTLMIDRFEFVSPFGRIGGLFNRVFLTGYMTRFLMKRNQSLKSDAEGLHQSAYRTDTAVRL